MASLLTIANKALRKLGVAEISSLSQQGRVADRCNSSVEDCVKEVLREHPWSNATEWASLARLVDAPPFGYQYAYQVPKNALRLIDVRESPDLKAEPIDFELARGGVVYTDAETCFARYTVYYESDLSTASPDFVDACACKLAAELAVPLAKSELASVMLNAYERAVDRAKLNDSSTKRERRIDQNRVTSFLTVREYPHQEENPWL